MIGEVQGQLTGVNTVPQPYILVEQGHVVRLFPKATTCPYSVEGADQWQKKFENTLTSKKFPQERDSPILRDLLEGTIRNKS
eukprot:scaffold1560_cov394-Pavlova_lutheri.AAC.6